MGEKTKSVSINIGGNATGNVIIAGDKNRAALYSEQVALPPEVNINAELAALREVLSKLQSPDQLKIDNAMSEAEAELQKKEPDKDEVGKALERALDYSKKAGTFSQIIQNLQPHVIGAVAWLGENWRFLIDLVK